MDNLIPICYDNPERPTVSGRELHDFLNIETPYAKWFSRMAEGGFFTEGEDFVLESVHRAHRPPAHYPDGQRAVHDSAQRARQAGAAVFPRH